MSAFQKKLSNLDNMTKKILNELDILNQDVESIDVSMCYLDELHNDLKYNITFLKQADIVSVMSSYRKSLDQLEKVKAALSKFSNLKAGVQAKIESRVAKYEESLDEFLKETAEQTVLYFNKDRNVKNKS